SQIPDNFATTGLQKKLDEKDFDQLAKGPLARAALEKTRQPEKSTKPGLLHKPELNLWKEAEVVYLFGIPILAFLCILLGLLYCWRIPASARTRGVAGGTVFLAFITFTAFAAYVATILMPILMPMAHLTDELPPETKAISWIVFLFFGPLTA